MPFQFLSFGASLLPSWFEQWRYWSSCTAWWYKYLQLSLIITSNVRCWKLFAKHKLVYLTVKSLLYLRSLCVINSHHFCHKRQKQTESHFYMTYFGCVHALNRTFWAFLFKKRLPRPGQQFLEFLFAITVLSPPK